MYFNPIGLPLLTPPQSTHTSLSFKKKSLESNCVSFWWFSYKISWFLRTENQFHAMVINETGFKVLISCPLCCRGAFLHLAADSSLPHTSSLIWVCLKFNKKLYPTQRFAIVLSPFFLFNNLSLITVFKTHSVNGFE